MKKFVFLSVALICIVLILWTLIADKEPMKKASENTADIQTVISEEAIEAYVDSKKTSEGYVILTVKDNEITLADYNYDGDMKNGKQYLKQIDENAVIYDFQRTLSRDAKGNLMDKNIKIEKISLKEFRGRVNENDMGFAYIETDEKQSIYQIVGYGETEIYE